MRQSKRKDCWIEELHHHQVRILYSGYGIGFMQGDRKGMFLMLISYHGTSDDELDDDKRLAAETIRSCLLSMAKSSIAKVESTHAIKDWWKKGSIVDNRDDELDTGKSEAPIAVDGVANGSESGFRSYDENLQWLPKTVVSAKGIPEAVKEMRLKSDKQLDQKLKEQVRGCFALLSLLNNGQNQHISWFACAGGTTTKVLSPNDNFVACIICYFVGCCKPPMAWIQ